MFCHACKSSDCVCTYYDIPCAPRTCNPQIPGPPGSDGSGNGIVIYNQDPSISFTGPGSQAFQWTQTGINVLQKDGDKVIYTFYINVDDNGIGGLSRCQFAPMNNSTRWVTPVIASPWQPMQIVMNLEIVRITSTSIYSIINRRTLINGVQVYNGGGRYPAQWQTGISNADIVADMDTTPFYLSIIINGGPVTTTIERVVVKKAIGI